MTMQTDLPLRMQHRLVPSQHSRASEIIIVETGEPRGDMLTNAELRVHAPGLKVRELQHMLACGLRPLANLHGSWVTNVVRKKGVTYVVTSSYDHLGQHTVDLILGVARATLQPLDIAQNRPVYTLRGRQRLILVDYELTTPTRLELRLPPELTAIHRAGLKRYLQSTLLWCPAKVVKVDKKKDVWRVIIELHPYRGEMAHKRLARLLETATNALAARMIPDRELLEGHGHYYELVFQTVHSPTPVS